MGTSPLLTPPPPIQACRVLLWRGDGNPGTWQKAGDLLAPRSGCLSSPSPFSFLTLLFYILLLLPLPPPRLPRSSLASLCPTSHFSVHLFYFKASFFFFFFLSLKYCKKGSSPPFPGAGETQRWKEGEKQKGGKEKLEFSYGRAKEMAKGEEKMG